jgi:hypothetical protein
MRVCVRITADGQVDPRWGRADRVAVAGTTRYRRSLPSTVGPGMQRTRLDGHTDRHWSWR